MTSADKAGSFTLFSDPGIPVHLDLHVLAALLEAGPESPIFC
jgi:hypothetical protein